MDFFGMAAAADATQHAEVELPDIPEYTPGELMTMERESTGLYLSGHPMHAYREKARAAGAAAIGAINEDFSREDGPQRFRDDQRITVAGIVTSSKTKTTRNNTLMAYVTVEDETGAIELLCFNKTLQTSGAYLRENQVVLVRGRLSVRDEKSPQILCDSASPMDGEVPVQAAQPRADVSKMAEGGTLFLRLPSAAGKEFRHVQLVLQMFPGTSPVKIRLTDTGKLLGTTCLLYQSLVDEMRSFLGEENVVLR